jgi:hypothetical protein
VTTGDNKAKAYTFTKDAGTRFNLLSDAQPIGFNRTTTVGSTVGHHS